MITPMHHEALRTLRTLSTVSVKEVINSHGKAKIFDILSNSLIKYFIQISIWVLFMNE